MPAIKNEKGKSAVEEFKRSDRPNRVKLTLSMTQEDRNKLEELANREGVTMAGLIHSWIREHSS